jgi:nephrocystin-4
MLNDVTTPVEEQLFTPGGEKPQIFLRPKESVNVPFKFLTLKANPTAEALTPSDPHRPFSQTAPLLAQRNQVFEQVESRVIKVSIDAQQSVSFLKCATCC